MATSTLGGLHVEITAGNKGLKTKVKEASDILKKGRKTLNDNAATWAKWGGAVAAASTVAAAAIFRTTSQSIKEIKNLSFAANTLTEDFQRGAFAAQRFGIEQEKYGDILKDVNDRIGDFLVTGAGPMVDFFEQVAPKVGVTAESFKNLSGQQSLGLFVKSLEDANLSQQEMTFHMEAIASDATLLLPLFRDNASLLNQFSEEAKALGIGLSAIDVDKVAQANKELSAVGGLLESTLQQATVKLSPVIAAIAEKFTEAAVEAGGLGGAVDSVFSFITDSIGFVLDALNGISVAFKGIEIVVRGATSFFAHLFEFVITGANHLKNAISDGILFPIKQILSLASNLPLIGDTFKGMEDAVKSFGESLKLEVPQIISDVSAASREAVLIAQDEMAAMLSAKIPSVALDDFLAQAEQKSMDAVQRVKDEEGGEGEGGEENFNASEKSKAILEDLRNRFKTERELEDEKFVLEQEALAENLRAKMVTQGEHDELQAEMTQAHEDRITEIKQASAQSQLTTAGNVVGAAADILRTGGKKTEKTVRNLAIAEALISGGKAAVSAFAAGMSVGGPFAPATAALYTAASIANTGAMIAKLKSGGKVSKPSSRAPRASGSSDSRSGNGGQSEGSNKRFDITLVGSTFNAETVRELMASIGEQVGDGVEFNVT